DQLEEIVSQWTVSRSPEEVMTILQTAGIPAAVSASNQDIAEDPHLEAGGFFVRVAHPEVGTRLHLGIPWHFSHSPLGVRRAAPCFGEHTDYVMSELLGYSSEEIARLKANKVLY